MSLTEKELNFLKRVTDLIDANARRATPGPWNLDHGNVIKRDVVRLTDGGVIDKSFDVAAAPWERRQAVRGVNTLRADDNMRHIVTCNPQTMLQLVEVVRKLIDGEDSRKPVCVSYSAPYVGYQMRDFENAEAAVKWLKDNQADYSFDLDRVEIREIGLSLDVYELMNKGACDDPQQTPPGGAAE